MYNPANWYWIVAGDETKAYSSAAAAYVPATDAAYTAWLASSGYPPTRIESEASLHDVLVQQYPAGVGQLGSVAQRASFLRAKGSTVTLTSAGAPTLSGDYFIDPKAMSDITSIQAGLSAGVVPGGGTSFAYPVGGTSVFTPAQFTQFAAAVLNYEFTLAYCEAGQAQTLPSPALTIP